MVKLVGILNVTPDSFSDGGLFNGPGEAIAQAEKLFAAGASLIDVGAESTRPGATPLTPHEEWGRLQAVLPELIRLYSGRLSLDTYHPETAEKALRLGPLIINDVTGMTNPRMLEVISHYQAPCIVSHLPGTNVQLAHHNKLLDDAITVKHDLLAKYDVLTALGIPQESIILDPGIGFGKTSELNWQLLRFAELVPGYSVMIGYSRKRFLGERRMEAAPNLAAGRIAATAGADYLRVHDVAAHASLLTQA